MKKNIYRLKIRSYFLHIVITSILFMATLIHIRFTKDVLKEELDRYSKLTHQVVGIRQLAQGVDRTAIYLKEYVITENVEYLKRYNNENYTDKNREYLVNSVCENEMLSSACPSLEKVTSYLIELSQYNLHAIENMESGNQQEAINKIFSANYRNLMDKVFENTDKFKTESINIINNEYDKVNQKISFYCYGNTILLFIYIFIILFFASKIYKLQEKFTKKMLRDSLTGLGNHQALFEKNNDNYALNCLVVDLLDFKFINQRYGHKNGDNTLIIVSRRVSEFFSKESIYRISGSKFVVLTKKKISEELLQDLISLINKPIRNKLSSGDIVVNSSIGVALQSLDIDNIYELVDIATVASITNQNKNSYTFATSETILDFTERTCLKDKLDAAIVLGTIIPYYQVIVDPHKDKVVGMNATPRWNDDGDILEPIDFYEFSKEVGLVFDVDITIFHQAIKDLVYLRNEDLVSNDFFISIKLSCFSLQRLNSKEILRLLNRFNLNAHNVQLEFTCEVFECTELIGLLQDLSAVGFRILIEDIDFNLSKINDLTNIDLGVCDILKYSLSENRIFYELLLDLTNKLDLSVRIKGVESPEELDVAMLFKNVYVQGVYFSKPVEIGVFVKLLSSIQGITN